MYFPLRYPKPKQTKLENTNIKNRSRGKYKAERVYSIRGDEHHKHFGIVEKEDKNHASHAAIKQSEQTARKKRKQNNPVRVFDRKGRKDAKQ